MADAGIGQSELARRVGVSQATIWKLIKEPTQGSKHTHRLASELGTTSAFLMDETEDPSGGRTPAPSPDQLAEQLGLIKVDEIDLAIGMGATFLDESAVQVVERWIPEDWVRQFTDAPANFLTIARPTGDSMYPTINDRDIVIIDRSAHAIDRQDAIWALSYGGLGTIKRVRAMPDGNYKLMADNPQVDFEVAVDGEMFVIGRVAGVIRKI